MGFLSLGLRVVMDRSCQSCSGIPREHIFKRVFLILRRCILTTLVCYINALTFIMHSVDRPRVFVRCLPVHLSPRLEVNKSRRVVMIVVPFEVSGIKCNGMTRRLLLVGGDRDRSDGGDRVTVRLPTG